MLIIEYDGTGYHGWQYQKEFKTVQGEIERVAEIFLKPGSKVKGASRTDAGVHAINQVANLHCESNMTTESIKEAFNFYLPDDIFIKDVKDVSDNFHARFSASSKTYLYRVLTGFSPLLRNRVWMIREKPSIKTLKELLKFFMDVSDYKHFTRIYDDNTKISLRRFFYKIEGNEIKFYIESPKFLYKMVRRIIGAVIEVSTGKRSIEELKRLVEYGDAPDFKPAPAHGLYLYKVHYEKGKISM